MALGSGMAADLLHRNRRQERRRLRVTASSIACWLAVLLTPDILRAYAYKPSSSKFTAVPPSPNPKSKQNAIFLEELARELGATDAILSDGRVRFSVMDYSTCSPVSSPGVGGLADTKGKTRTTTPPRCSWGSLLRSGVRSVRVVALDADFSSRGGVAELGTKSGGEDVVVDCLADWIVSETDWATALRRWGEFGNDPEPAGAEGEGDPCRVHVRCHRRHDCTIPHFGDGGDEEDGGSVSRRHLGSTEILGRRVATLLADKFGWIPEPRSRSATLEVHVILHSGKFVTVELSALVPPPTSSGGRIIGELPRPGFGRVESWAVARSASVQPGDVVLDPMCGRASFLIEAATFWPDASDYIGVDVDAGQLRDAALNLEDAGLVDVVRLARGDARDLRYVLPDGGGCVDKILCCPPFGRQYGFDRAEDGDDVDETTRTKPSQAESFYRSLFVEWYRVLKETGVMVLVIDEGNLEALLASLDRTGFCVEQVRDFFPLGRDVRRATIVTAAISRRGPRGREANHSGREENHVDADERPPDGMKVRATPPRQALRGKLPWETSDDVPPGYRKKHTDRALWSLLRARALPSLVPYTDRHSVLRHWRG